MPELPEVETVRRGLAPLLITRKIDRVVLRRPDLRFVLPRDFAGRLIGRRVVAIRRRAKFILVTLDDGVTWLIHLGMSGCFRISRRSDDFGKHDHLLFVSEDGVTLVYHDPRRFGFMDLVSLADLNSYPRLADLGTEPLTSEFSFAYLQPRLSSRSAPVKAVLLDQRVVPGMGNIYASESLFQAGISPLRQANTIGAAKARKLVRSIKDVFLRAIDAGGSSLRDHRHPSGELGYFQNEFSVYGREGQPCFRCAQSQSRRTGDVSRSGPSADESIIVRITQSGRSTFFCPRCQC